MKIGIVTQPLHNNYGGLLQNYALQQVLKGLGHEVYTINKCHLGIYAARWDIRFKFAIKQLIRKFIGRNYAPFYKDFLKIRQHCIKFVQENINTTKMYKSQGELEDIIAKEHFDAYIVGSDQVWRPCYSENIYNDFLDFCQTQAGIKRVVYAASFGVSEWEFSNEETKECSRLAKLFDSISVREDSGISLCKEHLGVDAIHVLDPTMLLDAKHYEQLADNAGEKKSEGDLFCYILDNNDIISQAIRDLEKSHSMTSFQVKSKKSGMLSNKSSIYDYIIPSPTKWIRAFMDAKMVFTDSFHGCVFSIIFNKPFWVIGNKNRGNARFDSLLKLFNLEDRRIDIAEVNTIDFTRPIDWSSVNDIKRKWQNKSTQFIKEYI